MQRLVSGLILLGLLAGCKTSPATPPPTPQSERTTITFACRNSEQVFYQDLVEQFESANPDMHVQLVFIDDVLNSASEDNSRQLMSSADTLAHSVSPAMTQQGLVYDLTPFIQDERGFDAKDFYPGVLESLQWKGGTWGLPAMIDSFSLIFFDKQIFDAAGVAYPRPGWTWDDLQDKAQALTERDGDDVTRWGFVTRSWNPTPFIQGRAGLPTDDSSSLLASILEQPAALEAVRWYTDLALVQQVMPPPGSDASILDSKAAQLIRDGQAAMWSEVTLLWDHWSAGRELGMAPFPVDGPESATTPVWIYSLVMSAGTTHPQESWRWLNFLSQQRLKGGVAIPARRSVAASSKYWEELDEERATVYRYALDHGLPQNSSIGWLNTNLYDALAAIFNGAADVEQALRQAQARAGEAVVEPLQDKPLQDKPLQDKPLQDKPLQDKPLQDKPLVVAAPTPTPVSPDDVQEIVFISGGLEWEMGDTYQALIEEFQRVHPNVVVKVLPFSALVEGSFSPQELLPVLVEKGDCFVDVWQPWSDAELANFLVLDPLLEADGAFPSDDFYPLALDALRVEGQLMALPKTIYPLMMFYNAQAFDEAGLRYPAPGWDLDDFVTLATSLTQGAGADQRYGYLYASLLADAMFFIEQSGARLMNDSTEPPTSYLNAPATIDAVHWYSNLSLTYDVMPEPGQQSADPLEQYNEWEAAIRSERAAMWSSLAVLTAPQIPFENTLEVGVAPMPQGPGQVVHFMLMAYYVSAQTEHPQACWEWLKFLTEQPELFSPYVETAHAGLPARRSVAASPIYSERVGPALAASYRAAAEQGERAVSLVSMNRPEIMLPLQWFEQALQAIMAGADVEQELDQAQRKVEAFIGCLETTTGLKDERELLDACIAQAQAAGP